MPRYKPVDRSPRFLPVVLSEQIQPGTFEFALDHLVDHELDLSALDAKFSNDEVGACAYDPRVLLAYSRGLVSSSSIEHACLHHVQFIAISGDRQPSYTHIAKFVRELKGQIQPLFTLMLLTCDLHKVQSNRAGGSSHQTMKNSLASTVISRCGHRRNRVIAQPR